MTPSAHLKSGSLLQGGKYRIDKVLGQGGFGITYLALQTGLNRNVAIKEFFMKELCNRDASTSEVSVGSEGSKDLVERFRKKFIKEAQIIAEMNNNHIIRIYDVFEEKGTAYYVMEYLEGGDLKNRIPADGIPVEFISGYIQQLGDALSYIHSKNILHLDIKPSNVLFRGELELVLIDFGISKHYDEDGGGQTSSTPVGMSRGYAPLEQYRQGGILHFSPSTDIYSFGATIYNMLTGVRPPDADEVQEDGLPPMPDKIPAYLKAAVEKAMSPRRKDRPQSVEEFMGMLNNCSDASNPIAVKLQVEETDLEEKKNEIEYFNNTEDTKKNGNLRDGSQSESRNQPEEEITSEHTENLKQIDSSNRENSLKSEPVNLSKKDTDKNPVLWKNILGVIFGFLLVIVVAFYLWLNRKEWGNNEDKIREEYLSESPSQQKDSLEQVQSLEVSARNSQEEIVIQKAKQDIESKLFDEEKVHQQALETEHKPEISIKENNQARLNVENESKQKEESEYKSEGDDRAEIDKKAELQEKLKAESERKSEEAAERKTAESRNAKQEHQRQSIANTMSKHQGHEWVDLGLSVKWATCNVGALTPGDYGNYYAWGETTNKTEYTKGNSKTYGKGLGDISGNSSYDAARANWGGKWRLPSQYELEELRVKCKWQWTTSNGHKGFKIIGPNGNSIFIPVGGWCRGTSCNDLGKYGEIWSSTPNGSDANDACCLGFDKGGQNVRWNDRRYGRSIRPVLE